VRPNRAYRIHGYGGPEVLHQDLAPVPTARPGQVLVKVKAAGVNGLDWKIREGLLRDVHTLAFPAVLGCELMGVVTSPGGGRFRTGDRVIGPASLGAYADTVAVGVATLCHVPEALTDVQAAALPAAILSGPPARVSPGDLGCDVGRWF